MNNVNWCFNNVTTKTYVTGITIYNTLTRFICATMFSGYIVETPINIVHGMWFDIERGNSSTWK
jgi:hypothetical protein